MRRWSTVAGVVSALCLLPAVVAWWPASAVTTDPSTLRARILASASQPYQGYVDSRGQIGLPSVPQISDVSTLFGGSSSIRVWYGSAQTWRVAMVDPTGERDIYQTPGATYSWNFARNTMTQVLGRLQERLPWAADVLPPDLARRLLNGAAAGDPVVTIGSLRVAGVIAAGLRLTPADPDTTVGRVDIWADPHTGLPLQVEVAARGQTEPVFRSRFLDLSQRPPDPGVLAPVLASGSEFVSTTPGAVSSAVNAAGPVYVRLPSLAGRPLALTPGSEVVWYGHGLSRFVVLLLPGRLGSQFFNAARDAGGASVQLADGQGYTLRNAVLTTLVMRIAGDRQTRRTFLVAGLVGPDLLARAGAELLAFEALPR
jgi:hypothetical protein